MRAGIGLLGILIVTAILFYVSFGSYGGSKNGYVGTVMKAGKEGQEQAQQMSGRTTDNVPIQDTIKMDEVDVGGEFRRLKVVSIVPNTPMETAYGLKAGDEITAVGGMNVRDNNDPGLAKAMVDEAYQRNQTLTILRNDKEITLTPKTPMSDMHPELFGKPGASSGTNNVPGLPMQAVPSH